MIFRKTTIILVPEGASHVKQLRVPGLVIFLPIFLFTACVIFFCLIIPDVKILRTKKPLLAQLEVENKEKERLFLVGTGCPEVSDFHIPLFNENEDNPWITLETVKSLAEEYPVRGFYRLKM